MRPPNPAVVAALSPFTIVAEIFGAPNILVEVLVFVTKSLRKITLPIADPLIDLVAHSRREQVPIAGVLTSDDEFRGTSVPQRETGSV
jgi:hypothetical protein